MMTLAGHVSKKMLSGTPASATHSKSDRPSPCSIALKPEQLDLNERKRLNLKGDTHFHTHSEDGDENTYRKSGCEPPIYW
jgi:hypothetical protein